MNQLEYQNLKVYGKILNIGCANDPAELKKRGAINLDICEIDPGTGERNKVDIIADARKLPEELFNKFNSIVVGDILEHCSDEDIVKILSEARECLEGDGIIIITYPEDHRDPINQHVNIRDTSLVYGEGISIFHCRPIKIERMQELIYEAKLEVVERESLDYAFCECGYGIIVKKRPE